MFFFAKLREKHENKLTVFKANVNHVKNNQVNVRSSKWI
jgi:hypothetical protein